MDKKWESNETNFVFGKSFTELYAHVALCSQCNENLTSRGFSRKKGVKSWKPEEKWQWGKSGTHSPVYYNFVSAQAQKRPLQKRQI